MVVQQDVIKNNAQTQQVHGSMPIGQKAWGWWLVKKGWDGSKSTTWATQRVVWQNTTQTQQQPTQNSAVLNQQAKMNKEESENLRDLYI